MLSEYLPASASVFSPTVSGSSRHDYGNEREVLFNMIFRMREEIDSLRGVVDSLRTAPGSQARRYDDDRQVVDLPRSLVRYTNAEPVETISTSQPQVVTIDPEETATRTLEDTERDTIRRALERNDGRRKATAAELNISERTLYRKIKEYGLE